MSLKFWALEVSSSDIEPHMSHHYISIQNPTVFSDGAWIFYFNSAKNQEDNFFFWNGGDQRRLSDG